jgi:hypothetical protein
MYFVPPFYPCEVTGMRAFIVNNPNFFGFSMLLMDDDGPNGSPLTVLDSVAVDPANVLTGLWNEVTLPSPITIDSGGFYVAWAMGGDGISVGQNQAPPFSNRTFEVLGQASNPASWSEYRYREIEDLMINAVINGVPLGVSEPSPKAFFGQVYPNPANHKCSVDFNLPGDNTSIRWNVTDVQGRTVLNGDLRQQGKKGTFVIPVGRLAGGVYQLAIHSDNQVVTRRISVIR